MSSSQVCTTARSLVRSLVGEEASLLLQEGAGVGESRTFAGKWRSKLPAHPTALALEWGKGNFFEEVQKQAACALHY